MSASCPLRVVEFYAGAGGFHYALLRSGTPVTVVASIDINTNTNLVYQHNFPDTPHLNRNICGLTARELDSLSGDVFVLSPPCQPFTRQGQRRDNLDTRTDSFFHLMHLLTEMKQLPTYLIMENVQGFECSQTREHFTTILSSLGFEYQEFLFSPVQFGVPNSRLRFYLLAKKKPLKFSLPDLDQPCYDPTPLLEIVTPNPHYSDPIINDPHSQSHFTEPVQPTDSTNNIHQTNCLTSSNTDSLSPTKRSSALGTSSKDNTDCKDLASEDQNTTLPQKPSQTSKTTLSQETVTLSSYLEDLSDDTLTNYLVPDKMLSKYAVAMDIVRGSCKRSCCFTRGYGHYAVGTGSVIQHCLGAKEMDIAFEGYRKSVEESKAGVESDPIATLRPLKLRYFTPREVANLMCFPPCFSFPTSLSTVQCYKVMGNSLNVLVVSVLAQYLFHCVS